MDGLTEGRIVHYVNDNGEHLPAIVVKVWDKENGTINLTVFSNHTTSALSLWGDDLAYARTSVNYAEEPAVNTWHWIEKA
jgi:hypothetical protein